MYIRHHLSYTLTWSRALWAYTSITILQYLAKCVLIVYSETSELCINTGPDSSSSTDIPTDNATEATNEATNEATTHMPTSNCECTAFNYFHMQLLSIFSCDYFFMCLTICMCFNVQLVLRMAYHQW